MNLDIHAIDELQKKGIPPTNDKPKYRYTSDEQGNYGESDIDFVSHLENIHIMYLLGNWK